MIRVMARTDVELSEIAEWRKSLGFFYLFEDLSAVVVGNKLAWEATILDRDKDIALLFKLVLG